MEQKQNHLSGAILCSSRRLAKRQLLHVYHQNHQRDAYEAYPCPLRHGSLLRGRDFEIEMFGLARLLWLNRLNKQETNAAKEDREMSGEINRAHSSEVTLQSSAGRESSRERRSQREIVQKNVSEM